nr:MalY/PatB family protein [uncultured Bacillus sp.]
MKYNFDDIINRRNTYSYKWDGGELIVKSGLTNRYDEETLPLFTADMDLPVPQPVIDALHKTVDHRIFGYSLFPDEYFAAIQHWFLRRHNWEIKREEIIYCPGTVYATRAAIQAFTEPGDGVIIQRPVYPPFTREITSSGRRVVNNALKYDGEGYYVIDFEDFEEKARNEKTKLFILCNPHNPTGRIFNRDELKRLSDICARNNVIIVADEIHGDLIRKDQIFIPIAKIADNTDHIITFTATNKTFNLAGLYCTNAIITNPNLRDTFSQAIDMKSVSPFSISALIAAYNEGENWLEQLKDYLDGTMEWVVQFLEEEMPKVKVKIPEGTYVMWMDFREYGLDPKEVHDRIYNKANVLLQDGVMFGREGLHHQRICIPSPRPLIKEAFERIAREFKDVH